MAAAQKLLLLYNVSSFPGKGCFFSYRGKIALQQFVQTDPTPLSTVPKQQYRDSSAIPCHGLKLLV